MIKDHFELKVPEMGTPLGKVTVQLCNAETGKIENEIEKTNYVNPHVLKIYEKLLHGVTNGYSINVASYTLRHMSRGLALTNADHEINTDEMFMKGELLAHAAFNDTTVSANQSGSFNTSESVTQNGLYQTKYVYEFPTNVANGTFQSIYTGNWQKATQGGVSVYKNMTFQSHPMFGTGYPGGISQVQWAKTFENGYAMYGGATQIGLFKMPTLTNVSYSSPTDIYERKMFNISNYASADLYGDYIYLNDVNYGITISRCNINNPPGTVERVGNLPIPSGWVINQWNNAIVIDRTNGYIFLEVRSSGMTDNIYTYRVAVFNIETLTFIRFIDGMEFRSTNQGIQNIPDMRNSTIIPDGNHYHIAKTGNSNYDYQGGNARVNAFYFESINHSAKPYFTTMGAKLGSWVAILDTYGGQLYYTFPSFFSRVLLDEPVVKQPTQTMKITYEFTTEPFSLI